MPTEISIRLLTAVAGPTSARKTMLQENAAPALNDTVSATAGDNPEDHQRHDDQRLDQIEPRKPLVLDRCRSQRGRRATWRDAGRRDPRGGSPATPRRSSASAVERIGGVQPTTVRRRAARRSSATPTAASRLRPIQDVRKNRRHRPRRRFTLHVAASPATVESSTTVAIVSATSSTPRRNRWGPASARANGSSPRAHQRAAAECRGRNDEARPDDDADPDARINRWPRVCG